MARSYAISLGALALGLLALRGALRFDLPYVVLTQGLVGMVVAIGIGYVIGAIADQVIRQTVETRFRERVEELFLQLEQRELELENKNANTD